MSFEGMSFEEMMSNVSQNDAMNDDAFKALWDTILSTWENIYTMLTSVKIVGVPIFIWLVTFVAIGVLLAVISNLSLGDASMSSVLGFGKNETRNTKGSDKSSKK